MNGNMGKEKFAIERQIYETQWINIRHHWTQTFAGITLLSTLITLAIIPIQYLRSTVAATCSVDIYIKWFVAMIILFLGTVTFLNQLNHYMRSKEARKVVVKIENEWGLYDKDGNFIYQDPNTNYSFGKFAGEEKRISNSFVQFAYIVVITFTGIFFVIFS